jgi:hypothetical protein
VAALVTTSDVTTTPYVHHLEHDMFSCARAVFVCACARLSKPAPLPSGAGRSESPLRRLNGLALTSLSEGEIICSHKDHSLDKAILYLT